MSDVVVILEKLKEEGFSLWLDGEKLRYKAPKESITKANLLTLKRNKEEIIQVLQNYSKRIVVEVDSDNRYEPFPLTDVQTAYLMGRNNLFDYGGVACHVYLELKYKNLDVSRVRLVWNKLIQTHDMLRTVVFEEGYQQVLKEVPELEIPYWDVSKGENICEYNDFRQQMGNHVYDTGKWPMFGIAIAKKAEESILHFSMDFLIADWTSIWMLLSEFEALYYLKKDSINVPQITFRDYLSAERKLKESERYVNDKRYWEKRIAYLPDAPELPTLSAEDVKKNFTRKLLCLDSERWNSFKDAISLLNKNTILFVHGAYHAAWCWEEHFIPFFYAHGYNVYAMSFRNHGNSERIENVDQIVVKDMVEDLIKTIDIIDGKIILIAHSLGCRIAQMCLEEIYSSIQSVVLITPMPVRNNFLQLLQMSKKQRKNNLEYILFSERLDSEQKEYYMSLLDKESKKVEYAMMKRQKKFSIYVRKIPTLVIGSYNDQCVILQAVKDNAKIHTAELKIVDSVCHDMMLDPDWRNIADLIFKFIEKTIDKKSGDNYNDNYVSTQAHQGGE